jgi:hypothetical protein
MHTLKSSFPGYITAGRLEFLDFQKYLAVASMTALIIFNFTGMAYWTQTLQFIAQDVGNN